MTVGGALERKFGCRIASVVREDNPQVTRSELVVCIRKMNSTRAKAFIRTFLMGLGFRLHSTNTFASLLRERPCAGQEGQREEAEILSLSSKIPSSVGRQPHEEVSDKLLAEGFNMRLEEVVQRWPFTLVFGSVHSHVLRAASAFLHDSGSSA